MQNKRTINMAYLLILEVYRMQNSFYFFHIVTRTIQLSEFNIIWFWESKLGFGKVNFI